MNEKLKKECMRICKKDGNCVDFDDENWEEKFIQTTRWHLISKNQKLSERFIEYFQNYVDFWSILNYQKLSEKFIEKNQGRIDWYYIYPNQKLSEGFIEKYRDKFSQFFWNLKMNEEKENDIKEAGYEILNDENGKYINTYKVIRLDNKSFHDPKNYEYIIGEIYESKCDCNILNENSYGLAAWDKENAIAFGNNYTGEKFKLIRVKIYINDIGAIIKNNNNKIRCFKFKVVEDLGVYNNGMNEEIKKECMRICKECEIVINFNDKDWENKFINKVNWNWSWILIHKKLSENFIEKFQDKVDWVLISKYQNLSEYFIEKFQDKVNWVLISKYQNLSEYFIEKFQDKVNWFCILYSQELSKEFIDKYKQKFSEFIWNLKSDDEKENDIKEAGYEILNDENGKYILAYKAIRPDNKSFYDPGNYKYIVGKTYESTCDCDLRNYNSYGLAAWDKENAIEFGKPDNFKLIKVKIYINDIGLIIKNNNNKIRCFKFQVVENLG